MSDDATPAPVSDHVVLPDIREAKTWDKASEALLTALEREEREAVAAFDAVKARAQRARRAVAAMRRIRDVVSLTGGQAALSAAVAPPVPVSGVVIPAQKWSREYAACRECGRTEVRHAARGLCFTCYSKASKSAQETA